MQKFKGRMKTKFQQIISFNDHKMNCLRIIAALRSLQHNALDLLLSLFEMFRYQKKYFPIKNERGDFGSVACFAGCENFYKFVDRNNLE